MGGLKKIRKLVFTATDSDYLQLDSLYTQPDNSTLSFDIDVLDDTAAATLLSNSTTEEVNLSSGDLVFKTNSISSTELVGLVTTGLHTITVRRGVAQNWVSIDGGTEELTTATAPLKIDVFYRLATTEYNGEIHEFTLDGSLVSLNKGHGNTFASDDGTITGTIETSAADPVNNVNFNIIKTVDSVTQRKRVLVPANSDYLQVDETVNWVNLSDVDLEVTFNSTYSAAASFFSKGSYNNANSGLVYIYKLSSTRGVIFRCGKNAVGETANEFDLPDGDAIVKVQGLDVLVNGVVEITMPELTIELSTTLFKARIGKLSYADAFYFNGDIEEFSLEGKRIPLNEGNGNTFASTDGTITGTCETSASDPTNYVNLTMIKPV